MKRKKKRDNIQRLGKMRNNGGCWGVGVGRQGETNRGSFFFFLIFVVISISLKSLGKWFFFFCLVIDQIPSFLLKITCSCHTLTLLPPLPPPPPPPPTSQPTFILTMNSKNEQYFFLKYCSSMEGKTGGKILLMNIKEGLKEMRRGMEKKREWMGGVKNCTYLYTQEEGRCITISCKIWKKSEININAICLFLKSYS